MKSFTDYLNCGNIRKKYKLLPVLRCEVAKQSIGGAGEKTTRLLDLMNWFLKLFPFSISIK